eukprot:COSAG06_NODE_16986_length_968_cov_11.884925_2_plen_94_part_00
MPKKTMRRRACEGARPVSARAFPSSPAKSKSESFLLNWKSSWIATREGTSGNFSRQGAQGRPRSSDRLPRTRGKREQTNRKTRRAHHPMMWRT